jgi:signal transduction histidine kinase
MDIMLLGSEGQVIGGEPVDIVGSRDGGRKFARHVVKSKQPLLVHNDTAAWQAVLPNARSLLVVPIPGRDDTVSGVIHIESVGEAVDESWIDVLQYLADLTGIGLEIAEEVDQQFRRVQSMVDELSHHISTPLQVIKLQVQTLASKELEGELPQSIASRVRDRLKAIERNADAIAEVRDYLRDVSRDLKVHKTEVDLLEVLDACRQEFEGELKEKHIVLTVPDRLTQELLIEADPNLIRYSFQCLLQNAIEAIDERRKRDTPGATTAAGDCITITIELSDPERVLVGIKDTGVGIAPEKRNRLFEPLFTTKKLNGRGGMGLFSVRRVLNMHGGSIIERSTPGEGADFIVTLPRK